MFLNSSDELLCSRRETGIGTDTDTKFSGKIGFQRQCLNLGTCISDNKVWKHADSEIIGNHRDHHMIIPGGKTDIRFDAGFFQYLMDVIIDTFRGNNERLIGHFCDWESFFSMHIHVFWGEWPSEDLRTVESIPENLHSQNKKRTHIVCGPPSVIDIIADKGSICNICKSF